MLPKRLVTLPSFYIVTGFEGNFTFCWYGVFVELLIFWNMKSVGAGAVHKCHSDEVMYMIESRVLETVTVKLGNGCICLCISSITGQVKR